VRLTQTPTRWEPVTDRMRRLREAFADRPTPPSRLRRQHPLGSDSTPSRASQNPPTPSRLDSARLAGISVPIRGASPLFRLLQSPPCHATDRSTPIANRRARGCARPRNTTAL